MKYLIVALSIFCLSACKKSTKPRAETPVPAKDEMAGQHADYPEALNKIFDAHGGLYNWKKKRTLAFDLAKPDGNETHTIDLHTRKDRIELPKVTMGFDGNAIWLYDVNDVYRGNAAVYHNLMFYFYAMPFVFGDPGIKYSDTEDLAYGQVSYPGIHISYDDGVGASPKDDYYLHYDPETYRMEWLRYTFTYGSDKKSDDVRWIRYSDWIDKEGVLLPKSLTWYSYEDHTPKEPKNPVVFENITLTETPKPNSFYRPSENAKVVLKP
ncbi:DUF6503 family protein [Pareuzebyella sediminis]|uniref:DUF6503 family protein n=1 Tax=Pareuzebyella sediminis TaxID=2607998 RepID=UPI0011ECED35|nr:DUF6503 family protein [Pareuzebyella sediminis]